MTPTAARTQQPALAALRRHVLGPCRYGGDARRCQTCRRDVKRETTQRG